MHRPLQILDLVLALIFESGSEAVANRFRHHARNRNTPRGGERLQPRRDIHAISVHGPVRLLDDIPEVHADAKAHALILRRRACTLG